MQVSTSRGYCAFRSWVIEAEGLRSESLAVCLFVLVSACTCVRVVAMAVLGMFCREEKYVCVSG